MTTAVATLFVYSVDSYYRRRRLATQDQLAAADSKGQLWVDPLTHEPVDESVGRRQRRHALILTVVTAPRHKRYELVDETRRLRLIRHESLFTLFQQYRSIGDLQITKPVWWPEFRVHRTSRGAWWAGSPVTSVTKNSSYDEVIDEVLARGRHRVVKVPTFFLDDFSARGGPVQRLG